MTEGTTARSRVDEPRGDGVREWETFVRFDPAEPLRHVGSVSAPTAEVAHEHAGTLYEDAETVWLCPAESVARFTTRTLGAREDSATPADGADEEGEAA